jgi:hypothetical protein
LFAGLYEDLVAQQLFELMKRIAMYAGILLSAQFLTVAVILYSTHMSDISELKGEYYGLDGPPKSESSFLWLLRAHEAVLFLIALWIAALVLSYANRRAGRLSSLGEKNGDHFSVNAAIVFPLACLLIGWVLGITMD